MITYETILWVSCIIIPYSWLFATIHKIWKECLLGYILITVFATAMLLRMLDVIKPLQWSYIYLSMVSIISISVVCYSLYIKYKRNKKLNLKEDFQI